MRVTQMNSGLKVHAVAGTYVVLLGFDLAEADCNGLLGFSIHRTDQTEQEAFFLLAMKAFAETDPGFPAGALYSTRDHPIQSFQWADYAAKPGHHYTYTITARKGTPAHLTSHAETVIDISFMTRARTIRNFATARRLLPRVLHRSARSAPGRSPIFLITSSS